MLCSDPLRRLDFRRLRAAALTICERHFAITQAPRRDSDSPSSVSKPQQDPQSDGRRTV